MEEIYFYEGDETLKQVSQRSSGGLIPGNLQGQVGRGSEQPGVVDDIPACCWAVGLDDLYRCLPTQSVL